MPRGRMRTLRRRTEWTNRPLSGADRDGPDARRDLLRWVIGQAPTASPRCRHEYARVRRSTGRRRRPDESTRDHPDPPLIFGCRSALRCLWSPRSIWGSWMPRVRPSCSTILYVRLHDRAWLALLRHVRSSRGQSLGGQVKVATRVVMASIRSVSISTPMPGPDGTAMWPSATVNSGDTMSWCQ